VISNVKKRNLEEKEHDSLNDYYEMAEHNQTKNPPGILGTVKGNQTKFGKQMLPNIQYYFNEIQHNSDCHLEFHKNAYAKWFETTASCR